MNNNKNKSKHIKSKYHKCFEKLNVSVKKYDFFKPNITKIDLIIDKCVRDFYYNYFHNLKTAYDVEMEDGYSFTSIRSDKKIKQFIRENCLIRKLAMKIHSYQQ